MALASPKPGLRYDLLRHPLAAGDAHPECHSCLHQKPFDYAPASLDSILLDRGVKKPDGRKVTTSTLVKFEQDSRTMSLVALFIDMTGAAAGRIIKEGMEEESLSQRAKDALQGVADL